jgi:gluconate 2-dehydrogenase gamma chain
MSDSSNIPRRDALKAMMAAAALPMLPESAAAGAPARAPLPVMEGGEEGAPPKALTGPRGTPSDPVLINAKATWKKVLTKQELVTLVALCDMIIPADDHGPAASTVHAHDYLNEWASAPDNSRGLVQVRGGLLWIDRESQQRFGVAFHAATAAQRTQICDDICYLPNAKPGFQAAARFFDTIRDVTATGYYTTKEGMKDVG